MTLKFELVLYHPRTDRHEEERLWSTILTTEEIHRHVTVAKEVGVFVADSRRVLLWAMRRIEGSTAGLTWTTFTLRGTRNLVTPLAAQEKAGGEAMPGEDSEIELPWSFNADAMLGSTTGWIVGSLGHFEGISLNELVATWGDFPRPEEAAGGEFFEEAFIEAALPLGSALGVQGTVNFGAGSDYAEVTIPAIAVTAGHRLVPAVRGGTADHPIADQDATVEELVPAIVAINPGASIVVGVHAPRRTWGQYIVDVVGTT